MVFDSMAMAAVAAEIHACVGAALQQVHQPDSETVLLALRTRGQTHRLLLSVHARHARVHFVRRALPHPATPPPFCMFLRKHLRGAVLTEARQVGFDRVLHLRFRRGEGEVTLILEAMGKHSNLILVGADGRVLDAIKRIGPAESRLRTVQPGQPYAPPPTAGKADPALATADEVRAALASTPDASLGDALRVHFCLSPAALEAVLARCREHADAVRLAEALRSVADATTYVPALVVDAQGNPAGISLLPDAPLSPGTHREPVSRVSEALETYYAHAIASEKFEACRREWRRRIADSIRLAEHRLREAEAGIEAARNAPDLEREATLLLANLHRIPRGAKSITVVDFYDPEQKEITLPLDPALTPQEQVERRFKRARKLVAAVPHLEQQRQKAQDDLQRLHAVRPLLEAAERLEDLQALEPTLREVGILDGPSEVPFFTPSGKTERTLGRRPHPFPGLQRRIIGNYEVLMGRNATENDLLTRQIAEPDDIWLHARGIPSAHVVIRTGRRPERVPPDVLQEAARWCALHSSAKHSRLVPVDYTLRRYVVKRRGSAPGEVQYSREKTLHVEPGLT